MNQKNKNEDIDLGVFLKKAKNLKRKSSMGFYKMSRFLLSNWIVLLVLVILGVAIGYFWEKLGKDSKESTMLVQINFGASSYVYNSVELLNGKIRDYDTLFFKEIGLYKQGEVLLGEIEIKPVVNLMDILGKMKEDGPDIEPFIEQAQYEDNLLTSEIFIPEYKIHEIKINTSELGNQQTLQKILAYFNKSELLQQTKKVIVENTKFKIKENLQSIASIDSITANYGKNPMGKGQANQIYFNSIENEIINLHLLYDTKKEIIQANEDLQVELLKYDNLVVPLSKPELTIKKSIDDKKMILLPVIFVLVFLFWTYLTRSYSKGKRLVGENSPRA